MGAVDASPAEHGVGLRVRRVEPGLVSPRVLAPGPVGRGSLLRGDRRPVAARRARGIARRSDRRHATGRRARRPAGASAARAERGARRRRRRDGQRGVWSGANWWSATRSARCRRRRRRCRSLATSRASRSRPGSAPPRNRRPSSATSAPRTGVRRSILLHRLLALGVAWGTVEEGRGSSGTFRETWRLSWEPELSIRLIERAGYGTTLEAAATARIVERAAQAAGITELIGLLDRALLAQLPDAIAPALDGLARRAAHRHRHRPRDGRVGPTRQCVALRRRARHRRRVVPRAVRRVRRTDPGRRRRLAWHRSTTSPRRSPSSGCRVCRPRSAMVDHPARHERFPDVLATLATGRAHGLVTGRATRLLHDSGDWTPTTSNGGCRRALSPGTPAPDGRGVRRGLPRRIGDGARPRCRAAGVSTRGWRR